MNVFIFSMQQMLLFSVPLLVAAMGGMFCERSGILNIGLEGNMIIGAFAGSLFLHFTADAAASQWVFLLAILVGGLMGLMYSMLHAVASISFNSNQAISGIALNIAASALCIYLARIIVGRQQVTYSNPFRIETVPMFGKIPLLGEILFQKTYISVYIAAVIFVVGTIIINKTKFGMRVRACGDNPQAAASVGIDVRRIRYGAVAICGCLAGMAGAMLVVPTTTEFNGSVAGYGFLSVAVLILGRWKPKGIIGAAIFFGFMKTMSAIYSTVPFLAGLGIDAFVYRMIPFVSTLVVLSIFSLKESGQPLAAGKPYDKGAR